jgi:hypothetical protein
MAPHDTISHVNMKADEREAAWHSDIYHNLHVHLLLVELDLAMRYACMNDLDALDLSTIARNFVSYLVFTAETAGERGYYRIERDGPRVAIASKRTFNRPIDN